MQNFKTLVSSEMQKINEEKAITNSLKLRIVHQGHHNGHVTCDMCVLDVFLQFYY